MTRHSIALLGAALLLSLFGPAPAGASAARSSRVSAHLTKTTFTAAQAAGVKLVYKVTRTSTLTCVLSRRQGTTWLKLRSVSQRVPAGSTRSLTVKQLFGGKTIAAALYGVKVSTRANGVTLRFTVTQPSPGGPTQGPGGGSTQGPGAFGKTGPANGAAGQPTTPSLAWQASSGATGYRYCIDTTPNNACDGSFTSTGAQTTATPTGLALGTTYYWQVEATNAHGTTPADGGNWFSFTVGGPQAGSWRSTSLGGATGYYVQITGVSFTVSSAGVSGFTFAYSYNVPASPAINGFCSGSGTGYSTDIPPAPITGGSFTSPSPSSVGGVVYGWQYRGIGFGDFSGTFDSPTTAHGTASLPWMLGTHCNPSSGTTGPFTWTAAWQGP